MTRKPKAGILEAEIAGLSDLGLTELRARWNDLYGRPAPKFFRRKLLVRAVAYQMQVNAYGSLSEETKRRLREIAAAVRDGAFDAVDLEPRIKPGTKLIRSWKKSTYEVMVLNDGFAWNGERYTSLSAIAKAITDTSWNGWRFFGVTRSKGSATHDSRGKFKRPAPDRRGKTVWPVTRKAAARRAAARKASPHA
jgi:hypothetical protein